MEPRIAVDDGEIRGALQGLLAFGRNPASALAQIAALGETATRLRFRTEQGPDGQRWVPSLRAQLSGGKTLTQDGHLSGSISSSSGTDYAEWGVNRIYAAIHQFGGVIRAKNAGSLKFALPGGGFAVVKAVCIPARPFLGISDDDRNDILDVLTHHLAGATGGAVHAG